MEPRNRVAKRAIPIEKNEVFLKKRRYGSGAKQSCGETGDSDRKNEVFLKKRRYGSGGAQSPFAARTIALAKRITPFCRQATK